MSKYELMPQAAVSSALFDFPSVEDSEIAHIAQEVDARGYAVLTNVIPEGEFAALRAFVEGELQKHAGEYFSFVGPEPVAGTLLQRLGTSNHLRGLLAGLGTRFLRRPLQSGAPFQVLRVLAGATGLDQAHRYHYDAYAVTALVPISVPRGSGEQNGDLILYPRLRGIRSNVVVNVLEKMLMQNRLVQRLMATATVQRLLGAQRVILEPGHIYVFRGYQSFHGNEPCATDKMRATAIFHFANPHGDSFLIKTIQRIRRWHEAKNERALAA
jgi:hypothetical protein